MSMLSWHYINTKAEWESADASLKTADKLYFIKDTKEIYKGTERFAESVELFTATEANSQPSVKAVGRIYINDKTLEGIVWTGSAWKTVINPVVNILSATDTKSPVTGKAVADYINSNVTVNAAVDLSITNSESGILIHLLDANGDQLGNDIELDVERFVQSGEYDSANKKIILYFDAAKTDKVEIPVADLVDTYTAEDTNTVAMSVSNNKFTANVKVSGKAGNALSAVSGDSAANNGLFVDISGKMDKDTDATSGHVATFDANGNAVDSGKTVGGATIASSPNASTLATEAAVEAIRAALATEISKKMSKVTGTHTDEIVTLTADGDAKASGKKAGGATLSTKDANTLATEAAVEAIRNKLDTDKMDKDTDAVQNNLAVFDQNGNAVDSSKKVGGATIASAPDTNTVATEAAIAAALSWKTTI